MLAYKIERNTITFVETKQEVKKKEEMCIGDI